MEDAIVQIMQTLLDKFPKAVIVYTALTGAYWIFCAIAAATKTDKDDKLAAKLKIFFSLPTKKP